MSNGKVMIILLTVGLIKKNLDYKCVVNIFHYIQVLEILRLI